MSTARAETQRGPADRVGHWVVFEKAGVEARVVPARATEKEALSAFYDYLTDKHSPEKLCLCDVTVVANGLANGEIELVSGDYQEGEV